MPDHRPNVGHLMIEVKAFGLNHAELHMRKEGWTKIAAVSGIECAGKIKSRPGGEFPVGARVTALLGSDGQ
jgi:NADPH:quinone reductase